MRRRCAMPGCWWFTSYGCPGDYCRRCVAHLREIELVLLDMERQGLVVRVPNTAHTP